MSSTNATKNIVNKSTTLLAEAAKPIQNAGEKTASDFAKASLTIKEFINNNWNLFLILSIVLLIVLIIIPFILKYIRKNSGSSISQERNLQVAKVTMRYEKWISGKFQPKSWDNTVKQLSERQKYLINMQPLTANIGGYFGPTEGYFSPESYVQLALRLGIRSFILPISTYIDDNKNPDNGWPASKNPAIVFRNSSGTILSRNGASVKEIVKALTTYNSVSGVQAKEPILLFILQDTRYIPNKSESEGEYVELMSKIAEELKEIPDTRRLTMVGSFGSAVAGMNERNILTQVPLERLENKILIFTDFDIGIYGKEKYKSKRPSLAEFTNFQLVPSIGGEGAGTAVSSSSTGRATKMLKLQDVIGSNAGWADKTRVDWHVTSGDDPSIIPSSESVSEGLSKGLQSIPLPLIYMAEKEEMEKLKKLWDMWGGSAFRVKGNDQRFTAPAPIVPAKPSDNLNARVDPNLQPGQVKI